MSIVVAGARAVRSPSHESVYPEHGLQIQAYLLNRPTPRRWRTSTLSHDCLARKPPPLNNLRRSCDAPRRVQLGSHRLKLWYLALCAYGRAWTRDGDMLEIGIKQKTLAGELETRLNVVSRTLRELRETGLGAGFPKEVPQHDPDLPDPTAAARYPTPRGI